MKTPIFSYPRAKSVVVCGDIHCDFLTLVGRMCLFLNMHDTLVIVAGDCGFGFEDYLCYKNLFQQYIEKYLIKHNCWIAMVRGNHDDPSYFSEQKMSHRRFCTIPDYSVIEACGHNILCVGGAISIDRTSRLEDMDNYPDKICYWPDEVVRYDAQKVQTITDSGIKIDAVVTHTAPSFCEFITKKGLEEWMEVDPDLDVDCYNERKQLDELYSHLCRDGHPLRYWYYGHFHHSWNSEIDGILFRMLNIIELHELPSGR